MAGEEIFSSGFQSNDMDSVGVGSSVDLRSKISCLLYSNSVLRVLNIYVGVVFSVFV